MRVGPRRGRTIHLEDSSAQFVRRAPGLTIIVIGFQLFSNLVVNLLVVLGLSLQVQRSLGRLLDFPTGSLELLDSFTGGGIGGQKVVGSTSDGGGGETTKDETVVGSGLGLKRRQRESMRHEGGLTASEANPRRMAGTTCRRAATRAPAAARRAGVNRAAILFSDESDVSECRAIISSSKTRWAEEPDDERRKEMENKRIGAYLQVKKMIESSMNTLSTHPTDLYPLLRCHHHPTHHATTTSPPRDWTSNRRE
jgi:hypothetical protein